MDPVVPTADDRVPAYQDLDALWRHAAAHEILAEMQRTRALP